MLHRSKWVLLVLALACATPVVAQRPDDVETLTRLSNEWMDAVARKDRASLEKFVAPEFELVTVGDARPGVPRSEWLDNAIRLDWDNRGYSDMRIDVIGDVAIVTSNYAFRVDPGRWKPTVAASAAIVDVWVRRNGSWQVHSRHLGTNTIEHWINRATGFIVAAAGIGIITVAKRLLQRRRSTA